MIIKDFPAFTFPPMRDCARCGHTVKADECGLPCDPEHPFYNRWICDDCLDQIAAQSEAEITGCCLFEMLCAWKGGSNRR